MQHMHAHTYSKPFFAHKQRVYDLKRRVMQHMHAHTYSKPFFAHKQHVYNLKQRAMQHMHAHTYSKPFFAHEQHVYNLNALLPKWTLVCLFCALSRIRRVLSLPVAVHI
jgi:SPX domain protein involved in polyphosphate accumulation